MNFDKLCRCCLSENRELKNISSYPDSGDEQETLSDIFSRCFSEEIKRDDGFPQNVCVFCITTLQMSYSFKKTIQKSKINLLQYLQNSNDATTDCSMDASIDTQLLCNKNVIGNIKHDIQQSNFDTSYYVDNSVDVQSNDEKNNLSQTSDIKTHIYTPLPDKNKYSNSKYPEKYFYCTECDSKYTESKKLYEHCSIHHRHGQISGRRCDYCTKRFQDFNSLLLHRRKHITPFLCTFCNKGYNNYDERNLHMKSCKIKTTLNESSCENKSQKVMCHVCGKSYPTTYIKIHVLIHTQGNIQCKYCEKTFKQPCSLRSHILWNHTREKNHKCGYCDMFFVTSSSKSTHIRKIHKGEKKYSCDMCGKNFFCSSDLKKHTLTHTGVKNYICAHCEKAYRSRYGLNVHIKSHHLQPMTS